MVLWRINICIYYLVQKHDVVVLGNQHDQDEVNILHCKRDYYTSTMVLMHGVIMKNIVSTTYMVAVALNVNGITL